MEVVNSVTDIITKFVIMGGGLWAVWGAVILGGALKDKNGPAMQAGIWQIMGGGVIIAAAAIFKTVTGA